MNQYDLKREGEKCWHGLYFGTTCSHCQREHEAEKKLKKARKERDALEAEVAMPCSGCGCSSSTPVAAALRERRSLAIEEAARMAAEILAYDGAPGSYVADQIRELAKLPLTLVAVEREKLDALRVAKETRANLYSAISALLGSAR